MATNADTIKVAEEMLMAMTGDTRTVTELREMSRTAALKRLRELGYDQNYLDSALSCKFVVDQWRKTGRQALSVHPEIVRDTRVASSEPIPGEVLRVLPYINPMIILPEPITFAISNKRYGAPGYAHSIDADRSFYVDGEDVLQIIGFVYFAKKWAADAPHLDTNTDQGMVLCDTNDPETQRLGAMVILKTFKATGELVGYEFNTISMPMQGTHTIPQIVDKLSENFAWGSSNSAARRDGSTDAAKDYLSDVLRVVVGVTMYLCSQTLDAEKVPRKHLAKMRPFIIARKPLSITNVGWNLGSALSRYRQMDPRTDNPSQMVDLGHQRDPEHRRGHFKMQPYGPNNSLRRLTYISPYWTHRERMGLQGMNTLRRVRTPREEASI